VLEKCYKAMLKDFMIVSNFFYYESVNDDFYKNRESRFIDAHAESLDSLRRYLMYLHKSELIATDSLKDQLDHISIEVQEYNSIFENMRALMFERGYKDFGVVGVMRNYAHLVEAMDAVSLSDILQLRRREKDFIIRSEDKYAELFRDDIKAYQLDILKDNSLSVHEKDSLRDLLNMYWIQFEKLQSLEKRIGFKTNTGLKLEFDRHKLNLDQHFQDAIIYAVQRERELTNELTNRMYVVLITVFFVSIALAFLISRKVTWRLSEIMKGMNVFVESGFEKRADSLCCMQRNDELGKLIVNYKIIEDKVVDLVKDFKRKVEERTKEVVAQKEHIEIQTEEIKSQRDELYWQNQYIEEQKLLVDKQNSQILDSLRYAAGIQLSLMPDEKRMKSVAEKYFVFFRPLDIISGDYFWVHRRKNKHVDLSFFVVADCTGHGVPGALMSMLGMSYLNELIVKQNLVAPAAILQKLRENIKSAMLYRKATAKAYDGMDIALAMIDNKQSKLYFSGANRNLYIARKGKMNVLKGDKMPIGHFLGEEKRFGESEFKLKTGDCIYAYSDGYPDQFGGINDKKMTTRRLNESLLANSGLPMSEQKQVLQDAFYDWKGAGDQIDDVLVLGVEWEKP